MNYRKMILPMLILTLTVGSLNGCQMAEHASQTSSVTADENNILIFYRNSSGTSAESIGYNLTSEGDAAIQEVFNILQNGQFNDGSAAVPAGVELTQSAWQEHSLALYLTGDYPEAGTASEILCRYAIAETMFQLPDVEGVTIYLDDQLLKDGNGLEIGTMTRESFVGNAEVSDYGQTVSQNIYYAGTDGVSMKACETELTDSGTDSMVRQILGKLMKGPSDGSCLPAIPTETEILGITVHDGICYLNLNSSFADEEMYVSDEVRIYSVVNSLTEMEAIDSVQFMINGASDYEYSEEISLLVPLKKNMDYVK